MKKVFALFAGLVASAFAGQTAAAGGYGSYGYGSYGSSYAAGYGSSGYSASYGSSGYSAAYGSSGYSASYGSSGYSTGYGSSGYSASYGSSGYSAAYGSSGYSTHRPGPIRRALQALHTRHAGSGSSGYTASYGSSGYSSSYGSSGYSASYGSSGYSSSYGSSGYSSGYGSSGYSSGYGSSGYSTGYGSSGYSTGYGVSGYSASSAVGSTYQGYAIQAPTSAPTVEGPFAAPAGYRWVQRNATVGSPVTTSSGMVNGYPVQAPSMLPTVDGPFPAPAGYRWVRRPRSVNVVPGLNNSGAIDSADSDVQLVSTSNESMSDEIQLTVKVSESAKIFVNGNSTTSTGEVRQFVSRGLTPDQEYRFEIRVEDTVDGEAVVDTKTLVLTPGQGEVVIFDLRSPNAPVETVLTLNVPADAKVTLAGNTTKSAGSNRTYRTQELKMGQVWDDYTISVTSNGVTKEKNIRLIAGDDIELSFDFNDQTNLVASK